MLSLSLSFPSNQTSETNQRIHHSISDERTPPPLGIDKPTIRIAKAKVKKIETRKKKQEMK